MRDPSCSIPRQTLWYRNKKAKPHRNSPHSSAHTVAAVFSLEQHRAVIPAKSMASFIPGRPWTNCDDDTHTTVTMDDDGDGEQNSNLLNLSCNSDSEDSSSDDSSKNSVHNSSSSEDNGTINSISSSDYSLSDHDSVDDFRLLSRLLPCR